MIRVFVLIVFAALLGGCAAFYTFEGKQYKSKQEFMAAVDGSTQAAAAAVVPLPAPVSTKTLLFALPSPTVIAEASARYHTNAKGSAPTGPQMQIMQDVAQANYKSAKAFYEAAARKNIYKAVRFMELDSLMASPQPSATEDVIYYYETGPGSGSWYFATQKTGKQVFAYDRAQPGQMGKTKAFVDALQVQAIRE